MSENPIDTLDLFAGCTRHDRELVGRLSSRLEAAAGTVLCAEGDPGLNFFVLVEGHAEVSVDGEAVADLGPGCGFGEIALLPRGGRRIASVTITVPSTVLVLSRPEFATLMAELPAFARRVLAESRRRVEARGHEDGPWVTS